MDLNVTTLIAGGAGIGLLRASWGKIKALCLQAWSLLFVTITITDDSLASALRMWIWQRCKRQRAGGRCYSSWWKWVRPLKGYRHVGYETLGRGTTIFRLGWRPLFISTGRKEKEEGEGTKTPELVTGEKEDVRLSITFIRGTFKPDVLVIEALQGLDDLIRYGEKDTAGSRHRVIHVVGDPLRKRWAEGETTRRLYGDKKTACGDFTIPNVRLLNWAAHDLGYKDAVEGSALGSLALCPEAERVVEEVHDWLGSKEWHEERGIPWKRGFLLVGPPGCGKTSIVRALAYDYDLPVWIYDLATLSNRDLMLEWTEMLGSTPCVALMEDIDAVFDGRRNIVGEAGGGLTFNCLLNCVDGLVRTDGVMFVITSNVPDKLDAALAELTPQGQTSRPGRIDSIVKLGVLPEDCRWRLAQRIMAGLPDELIRGAVEKGTADVAGQFQERCMSIALHHFWHGEDRK